MYYLLHTLNFTSLNGGSSVPTLNRNFLSSIKSKLPPLPTQQKIASILGAYDDSIENNLKRIQLLEEAAQNLYKEWFVNFRFPNHENHPFDEETGLPEGWEKKGFDEIASINNKKRKPLNKIEREKSKGIYPYYGATGIMDYVNDYLFDGRYLLIAEDGTVTDKNGNPYLQLVEGKFWVNNHAHIIKGKILDTEFVYQSLKNYNVMHLITGAVQLKLSMRNLKKVELIVPDNETLAYYSKLLKLNIDKIFNLKNQNKVLKEARDLLLPRLMNQDLKI